MRISAQKAAILASLCACALAAALAVRPHLVMSCDIGLGVTGIDPTTAAISVALTNLTKDALVLNRIQILEFMEDIRLRIGSEKWEILAFSEDHHGVHIGHRDRYEFVLLPDKVAELSLRCWRIRPKAEGEENQDAGKWDYHYKGELPALLAGSRTPVSLHVLGSGSLPALPRRATAGAAPHSTTND